MKMLRRLIWAAVTLLPLMAQGQGNPYSQEVLVGEWRNDLTTLNQLRDQRAYPDVRIEADCPPRVAECSTRIVNQDDRTLRRYPPNYDVTLVAAGRHSDVAYLLYRRSIPVIRNERETFIVTHWLVNDRGQRRQYSLDSTVFTGSAILADGSVLNVSYSGATQIDRHGQRQTLIDFPEGVRDFSLTLGLNSHVAIVLRLKDDSVWACNLRSCADSGIELSERGDRSDILSVYPRTETQLYVVAYKYINAYNKGLQGSEVDLDTQQRTHGWLAHSMDRNLGFSPHVMVVDENLIVQARNTTQRSSFALHHPVDTWASALNPWPEIPPQFNHVSFFELQASSGLQRVNSLMWNGVDFNDDATRRHSRVNYELEPGWGTLFALEGRAGGRYLALSYLQQIDDRIAKASRWLSLVLDLNRLGELSDSQTGLRFELERSELWGDASVRMPGSRDNVNDVSIERQRYALLATMERGLFYGLSYTRQTQPAVVGFSDAPKDIVYSAFVPDLTVNALQLQIGYDQLAYSRRYETNYNAFYIDGSVSMGLGWLDDARDLAKVALEEVNQTDERRSPFFAVSFTSELGYQVQRRSTRFWGAGVSAQAGYRATGYMFEQGQGEESEIKSREITRELSISGFQHGPFATLSLIF